MKAKPMCEMENTCLLLVCLLATLIIPKVRGICEVRVSRCANEGPGSGRIKINIEKKTVGRET